MVKNTGERIAPIRPTEGKFVTRSPIEDFLTLNNRFNELFGHGFGYTPLARMLPGTMAFEPMVDIVYTDLNVEFYIALPGFTLETITVEAVPDAITVSGERKPLYVLPNERIAEGWAGTPINFKVEYPLAVEIDPAEVTATFNDGVLRLVLPLVSPTKVKITPVKVVAG